MNKWECKGIVEFYQGDKTKAIRTFESSSQKMSFSLKVLKNGYLDCETWNKSIIENLNHGDSVNLTNYRVTKNIWQDKNTGEKKSKMVLVVEELERIAKGGEGGQSGFVDRTTSIQEVPKNDLINQEELVELFEDEEPNIGFDMKEVE